MIRQASLRSALLPLALAFAAGAVAEPMAIAGQEAAPDAVTVPATPDAAGATIRLSDRERDAILDRNTVESAAIARGEVGGPGSPGRGIHGEMGVEIGSNGTRGVYGTAAIPLGDNAGAVVSFEDSRSGRSPR